MVCSLLLPGALHDPTTMDLPVVGHRGYFQFGAILNKLAMNIHV